MVVTTWRNIQILSIENKTESTMGLRVLPCMHVDDRDNVTQHSNHSRVRLSSCPSKTWQRACMLINLYNGLESFITGKNNLPIVQWFHTFTPSTFLSRNGHIKSGDFNWLDRKSSVANVANQLRGDRNFIKRRHSPRHNNSGHHLAKLSTRERNSRN